MSPDLLASLVPALLTDVARYGYVSLALGITLESAGVPVPGETMLLLASGIAAQGRLSAPMVALVAAASAIAGDNIGFAVGRLGGRRLLARLQRRILPAGALQRMDRFYERRGAVAVVLARFVAGLRVIGALAAGASDMPWRTFLAANAAGAVLWAGGVTAIGYFAGQVAPALGLFHLTAQRLTALAALGLVGWLGARALLAERGRKG